MVLAKRTYYYVEWVPEVFPGMLLRIYEEDPKKIVEEFRRKAKKVEYFYKRKLMLCHNCRQQFYPKHYWRINGKRIFLCPSCEALIFGEKHASRGKGED